ncbi:hypothetical protein FO519_002959 [Halicephalobus sp. NKZ332]|nr:hypothetical protein FO519_002959 [Halicephalobus sp. NKZ332]
MSVRLERRHSSEALMAFEYSLSSGEVFMDPEDLLPYRRQCQKLFCKLILHLITIALFPIFGVLILQIVCQMPYELAEKRIEKDPGKYEGFLTLKEFTATAEVVEYLRILSDFEPGSLPNSPTTASPAELGSENLEHLPRTSI